MVRRIGQTAYTGIRPRSRYSAHMDGTHSIEDHLRDDWVDAWIAEGLDAVETFLRNHAAFDTFLEDRE